MNLARRVLGYLVEILVDIDAAADDWGRRLAAHLVQAMRREDEFRFAAPDAVQRKLDAWIAERLLVDGEEFEKDLQLAADVGSADSNPSEVARWLLHVKRKAPDWGFGSGWSPNPDTSTWYERMAADRGTQAICSRFVREVLPSTNLSYPRDFSDHAARLSPNLAPAFREAASRILGFGYLSNADTIAEGAIADLASFGPVLDEAIAARDDAYGRDNSKLWLEIANGQYSEDYAQHLQEQAGEDIYTSNLLIDAYVERLRTLQGRTLIGVSGSGSPESRPARTCRRASPARLGGNASWSAW